MKFPDIRRILATQFNCERKTVTRPCFSTIRGYLVATGVVLLFVFLWVNSQAINFNQHNRYAINLRFSQELDARINQNVLEARYGFLTYYDPIVNDLARLKKLQTDLKQTPTFVDSAGREELSSLLQTYIKVWQEKEKHIQRFQSQNAVLRNSLSYFPIAIADLVKKDTTSPALATQLNTLLRNILLFNLSSDEELVPRINREIEQILADSTTTAKSTDLKMAIAHARIILKSLALVNSQVKTIMALPTTKRSESLAQAYDRSYQQALNTTNTYRLWLYLLSIVLLVSVAAWIILRLKASADAIRQAEEKYRSIFENSVAGIFQTTPDGRYLSANPTLAAICGYESTEDLIQNITNIEQQLYVSPERRAELVRLIQKKGSVADFESQVYRKDGTTIWISENARSVCDRRGKLLYYEGTVTDITARKQAEAALQASEAQLRLLFAAMTDTVVVFDDEGRYLKYIHTQSLDYKPHVKRIGKTVHEVLPMAIADLFVGAIRQALYAREQSSNLLDCLESAPLSQKSISVEYCLPIRGNKTWFSASVSALSENTVLWVARDITKRKRIESALRASKARFASIFHSSPCPFAIATFKEGRFIEVNDSWCRATGYKPEEVIGRTSFELNFYNNPEERSTIIQTLQQTGAIRNQEIEIRIKSGEVLTALFSAELIDLDGQTSILYVSNDITDRKRAEAALQQAMSAAEVANRAKSQFLSNMSHELRTPLNVILGFTQLMTRNGSLTPIQQGYLDTIGRSGEHLLGLINDVLEMSKIEAGRTTLNENSFAVYGLLDWLQQMFRLKAESKGLELVFDLATDLPQYIRTDESKLRQVLINLLGNAVKFTQAGSVTLRVSVVSGQWSLVNSNQQMTNDKKRITIHFAVEDTGPGIATKELEILFDPFVQTEAGRNSQEGTGLGLPISQKFVHLMGGEITVESRLGEGAVFKFDIPTSAVEPDELQAQEPSRQVVGLEAGQPNYRILVVEDKQENRRLIVELLTSVGFEVRDSTNGQEAIALWKSWSPHLIWMDMRMPVMDGFEATKQIKTAGSLAPRVIALTGSAFEEDRVAALSTGCDDFVRKPFRAEVIFEKMALHLGVRYLYASPQLRNNSGENSLVLPQQQSIPPSEFKKALAVMPVEWIEQLHQAATKVNAKQVLKLIEQIPSSNTPLANALTDLVNNFCFEEIVNLIPNSPPL